MTKNMTATVELAMELIRRRSITPNDEGCQKLLADRLQPLGFSVEELRFEDVNNIWARRGSSSPLFVFAGHTDVVPPGNEAQWTNPPFNPAIIDGNLHGRGSADMKSAIAAMVVAVENHLARGNDAGSIAFLITSDEEGAAVNGTAKVVELLQSRNETIDFCIVGESTCVNTLCDTIKNGRRGSLGAVLRIIGVQGHVAYPERADNPIHRFAPALTDLCNEKWDGGNEFFSPTTFQISNLNSGTGASNVVPGELTAHFNFRFSSAITADELKQRVHAILDKHGLSYELAWTLYGLPFLTQPGTLIEAVQQSVLETTGKETTLSTSGGTSDARFIAPTGAQVVEVGLVNETIHKVNEHVKAADLDTLREIYERVLFKLLG